MEGKGIMQDAKKVREKMKSFVQFKECPDVIDRKEVDEKLGNMEETGQNEDGKELLCNKL